ncbi:MAG: hypothetical protein LV477_10860 [Candidatus Nitrosotalea sp.]|nr:hypothetical protein [Candidatus Nitrosotalea sp.]
MSTKILLSIPIFVVLLAVGASQLAHGDSSGQIQDNSQISISSPMMVDATGHAISSFQVGQQIGIQSMLTNHEAHDQRFAYVVEAMDKNHVLDYFEGFSASMLNNQSFTATQVWTPREAGNYTVQVFVWDNLASAALLSDVMEKQITVQAPEDASVPTTIQKSSESEIWFEYTPVCCNGTSWEKYPSPLPEFLKIKDYFNSFGITVIKSMQTHANCDYCTEINGKPLDYSYYLLVPSSDENKMLNLGFKKVDAIPSDVSTAGM